jgi:hypothetical protein
VGAQIAADAAPVAVPPEPKKDAKKNPALANAALSNGGVGVPKSTCKVGQLSVVGTDSQVDAAGGCSALSETEKQLRALKKKLRQIEIIEEKTAPTQEELEKASKKLEIQEALAKLMK